MIGLIYKITNPKGLIYIGQTCDYEKRLKAYKSKSFRFQVKLFRSISKYGYDNHRFEIIENHIPVENLNNTETHYITHYNSFKRGLNCTPTGGSPMRGRKHSVDTKTRMSESRKGALRGPYSEEAKKKASESALLAYKNGTRTAPNKGKNLSEVTKRKLSSYRVEMKLSETTKRKISESLKGKKSRNRKLLDEVVLQIKEGFEKGFPAKSIAEKYGINLSTVNNYKYR